MDNRYRYAGKEEQRFGTSSSELLDFGARYYDPWTCQWTGVDPMAEKYLSFSPYVYCSDSPVVFVDPDGSKIVIGSYSQQLRLDSEKILPCLKSDDQFVARVSSQLEQLKAMDPVLYEAVSSIENSGKPYLIVPVSNRHSGKGNGYYAPTNEIYYDPDNYISPLPNEEYRDPIAGLAHEIGHAQNDENNTRVVVNDQDMKDLYGERGTAAKEAAILKLNGREANSIKLENIVREKIGLNLRSYNYVQGTVK